jgi:hypothetical protein
MNVSKGKQLQIRAQWLANLREVVGDRHVITVTAGPALEPIVLSLGRTPDYRRENAAGASFSKQRAAEPNDFQIHYRAGADGHFVALASTLENYHFVQPLGDDEWLLVRGRAQSETDENAHVYGPQGLHRRSFALGDGIEDVQATRDPKVWVSFFDEGVFSHVALGQTGLICVDKRGVKLHDFATIAATTGAISDCYALNVADDHDTWVYYFTDFPLVKLTDGKLASFWRNVPVKGSRASALAEGRILFAGSYKDRSSLFEVRLPSSVRRNVPVDENGTRIGRFAVFGRSHCLFLTTDDSLFLVDASSP